MERGVNYFFYDGESDYTESEPWDFENSSVRVYIDDLPEGEQIRIKRHHDYLSRQELASKLGMSVSTLATIERGDREVSTKCKEAVRKYLYHTYYYLGILGSEIEEDDD